MVELNYFEHYRIVLFKCDWFDTKEGMGVKKDALGFTREFLKVNSHKYKFT